MSCCGTHPHTRIIIVLISYLEAYRLWMCSLEEILYFCSYGLFIAWIFGFFSCREFILACVMCIMETSPWIFALPFMPFRVFRDIPGTLIFDNFT